MYRPRLILQMQILNLTMYLIFSQVVYFSIENIELAWGGKLTESRISDGEIKCVIFYPEYINTQSYDQDLK